LNDYVAKNKDVYWQYVRGICIICVVLIHCKSGIGYENNLTGAWNFDYWLILRQFINFPVAVFIFLAGYFTNIEKAKKQYITYISNRGRLLVSFLIWSTFYTLINIIVSDGSVNILKTLAKLLLGLSSGPLYFIVVLLQLTVLTPVLIRTIQTDRGTKFLFLVTPIYFLLLYSYSVIYKTQMPFYQTFFFGMVYLLLFWIVDKNKRIRTNFQKESTLFNFMLFYWIGI
jgi:surface polysaccharide O-acyltransferase-like enzyme